MGLEKRSMISVALDAVRIVIVCVIGLQKLQLVC